MKSEDYIKGVEDSAGMLEQAAAAVGRMRVLAKVSSFSQRTEQAGEAVNEKLMLQAASLLRNYAADLRGGAQPQPDKESGTAAG